MRARSSCLSNGSSTKSSAPASSAAILSWSGFAVTITIGTNLVARSEEHTSELQSQSNLVCRLLLEKKKTPLPVTLPNLPSTDSALPIHPFLPITMGPYLLNHVSSLHYIEHLTHTLPTTPDYSTPAA